MVLSHLLQFSKNFLFHKYKQMLSHYLKRQNVIKERIREWFHNVWKQHSFFLIFSSSTSKLLDPSRSVGADITLCNFNWLSVPIPLLLKSGPLTFIPFVPFSFGIILSLFFHTSRKIVKLNNRQRYRLCWVSRLLSRYYRQQQRVGVFLKIETSSLIKWNIKL